MRIKQLKDISSNFFPITHEDAVIDNNGINLSTKLNLKLETLISGQNIKTVNNTSLLGSGNISVYTKPTNGIPASDLSNDIQTNLTLASTALQSFTETDPTVPSHVKNITSQDITNWDNKISKVSNAVEGNLVTLNSDGGLVDSGMAAFNLNSSNFEEKEFSYCPTSEVVDNPVLNIEIETVKGQTVAWNQLFYNSDDWIDMGLPSGTLWCTKNIDLTQPNKLAASPYQYDCSFFSWGNIDGHNPISDTAFDYNWGGINSSEPWYENQPYGETSGSTLDTNIPENDTYDAARANLGAIFRLPTSAQFQELFDNSIFIDADGTEVDTTQVSKLVIVNGIVGIYIQSKLNDARLFFSCSGSGNGRSWPYRRVMGSYWSSTRASARYARSLDFFQSGGVIPQNSNSRHLGLAVRPILTKSNLSLIGSNNHKFIVSNNGKNLFDLTLIYGLGNEPSTVAQFEADYQRWFGKPLTYEPYDAGSLRNVQMEGIKSVGFNQYNSTTGTANVIGGNQYQITGTYTSLTLNGESVTPDSNGKFTPSVGGTLTVTGGSTDTCVHLVWSGTKDGTYEPYEEHEVSIPVTTLTGKLNGEGESVVIFPDGMKGVGDIKDEIYYVGGKTYAIKRVGRVDLGGFDWTKHPGATGTENDVYFRSTITPIGVKKATNIAILCSNYKIKSWISIYKNVSENYNSNGIGTYLGHPAINDSSYTDVATFKTAMSGVMLDYELAEPLVYEVDDFNLPVDCKVNIDGTIEVLNTSNGVCPILEIREGINAVSILQNLPKIYEKLNNKVTTITSNSTNEQYPSAKCIYNNYYNKNEIDSTLGNILFILDEIIGEYESSSEA